MKTNPFSLAQEEPEDYPFPLTLKTKKPGSSIGEGSGATTPTLVNGSNNGNGTALPIRPA